MPDRGSALLVLLLAAGPALLAPFGLMLIVAGLGRGRNLTHSLLSALVAWSCAALGYAVLGASFGGYPGTPAHRFSLAGQSWNWLGAGGWWLHSIPAADATWAAVWRLMGMLAAGWAAIILSTGALERWKLSRLALASFCFGAFLFPLPLHWLWARGWLSRLGAHFGLGQGALDIGGAGVIQVMGGMGALALVWQLGARRHKYNKQGEPNALPGHSSMLVLAGCGLALAGWLAWNAATTLLVAQAAPGMLARAEIHTLLAAAAAFLIALLLGRWRFGRPDASMAANAWIAGLAATGAAAPFLSSFAAVLIAAAAGALVFFSIPWLEKTLRMDDPAGAVPAHLLGGLWGLLAAGLFAVIPYSITAGSTIANAATPHVAHGQFLAQLLAVATLLGCLLPLIYGLIWAIERLWPGRVEPEAEAQGLDLYELGSSAYPEFVTHSDEFLP